MNTRTIFAHAHNNEIHKEYGSATFVLEVDSETNLFTLGVAVCSKNDQFSRKEGRRVAQNRLADGKEVTTGYYHPSLDPLTNATLALNDYYVVNRDEGSSPTMHLFSVAVTALKGVRSWGQ